MERSLSTGLRQTKKEKKSCPSSLFFSTIWTFCLNNLMMKICEFCFTLLKLPLAYFPMFCCTHLVHNIKFKCPKVSSMSGINFLDSNKIGHLLFYWPIARHIAEAIEPQEVAEMFVSIKKIKGLAQQSIWELSPRPSVRPMLPCAAHKKSWPRSHTPSERSEVLLFNDRSTIMSGDGTCKTQADSSCHRFALQFPLPRCNLDSCWKNIISGYF